MHISLALLGRGGTAESRDGEGDGYHQASNKLAPSAGADTYVSARNKASPIRGEVAFAKQMSEGFLRLSEL